MPPGQPILVDHPSAGVLRRHYEEVTRLTEDGIRVGQAASELREAAAAAEAGVRVRSAPVTVANRIARLEAEHRNATGADVQRLAGELAHWQQVRAGQVATGRALGLSRDQVSPGDRVRLRGRWYTVTRVNRTTVSVAGQPGRAAKVPYPSIDEHQPAIEGSVGDGSVGQNHSA